ncbi:hypothetical protein JAAARDRAFT_62625 [Jaapia argillacea MUCL 33604]|uniref:Uncharacterized protein n=1 Tax=Jaapia argillacea MUCL 33604 TaxID=933084 RepID=A0A067PL67_9AGAM|nr:hypothetical protein JAAARDRAFT_62625 [Jaapia argillacea MUCL 33604]
MLMAQNRGHAQVEAQVAQETFNGVGNLNYQAPINNFEQYGQQENPVDPQFAQFVEHGKYEPFLNVNGMGQQPFQQQFTDMAADAPMAFDLNNGLQYQGYGQEDPIDFSFLVNDVPQVNFAFPEAVPGSSPASSLYASSFSGESEGLDQSPRLWPDDDLSAYPSPRSSYFSSQPPSPSRSPRLSPRPSRS